MVLPSAWYVTKTTRKAGISDVLIILCGNLHLQVTPFHAPGSPGSMQGK